MEHSDLIKTIQAEPEKAYAIATGSPGMATGLHRIPEHMRPGLVRYILTGVQPGRFLTAVLEGDLFEALRKADEENAERLRDYGIFLYNYAPAGCFGSAERRMEWTASGGLLTQQINGTSEV